MQLIPFLNAEHSVPPSVPVGLNLCLRHQGAPASKRTQRFAKHKQGVRSGKGYVRDYGLTLLPDLFEHENPLTYEAACQREVSLAEELRAQGHAVRQN